MKWVVAIVCLLSAAPSHAVVVTPAKADGDFISGTDIPGDNFTSATAGTGEAVFLKARSRDSGQPLAQVGNRYFVLTGSASDNVNPWWSFDYQFSPDVPPLTTYNLRLDVDFDPAVGVASFKTISLPVIDGDAVATNSWDDGDGFFTNPGSGAWTDDTTPYVVANSWHLSFGFWSAVGPSGLTYDRNLPGEYEIRLTALDGATELASATIFAEAVVPEASQLCMLGLTLAGCGLAAYLRRR
jgi:hypothetical protein